MLRLGLIYALMERPRTFALNTCRQGLRISEDGQLHKNEGFVVRPARLELAAF